MAFPQPNPQRELASRKILEELNIKKQLLLKQGVVNSLAAAPPSGGVSPLPEGHVSSTQPLITQHLTTQRNALKAANQHSTGYFVTQDSLFEMYPCMKLRHLEEALQGLEEFEKPKIKLEQYVTPPHLACHMLHTIQSQYGDINGKLVADLGCGCGALSVGASVLDASLVVGFEIDEDALETMQKNVSDMEITNVDTVLSNVKEISSRWDRTFDTVIMNPPFGTKRNAGMDIEFLKTALRLTNNVAYSLHKTSTREYVLNQAKILGAQAEVLAELRYDLPQTYKFHKQKSVDIEVDFIRFTVNN